MISLIDMFYWCKKKKTQKNICIFFKVDVMHMSRHVFLMLCLNYSNNTTEKLDLSFCQLF